MTGIFISHSSKDTDFARKLAGDLSDRLGAKVWIDVDNIPPGTNWSNAISDGLRESKVMLLIISPDSMASRNVENEWGDYFDHNKLIIPILWKPTDVHFQLRRLQYIDFYSKDYETAFQQLQAFLKRGVPVASRPTTYRILPSPMIATGLVILLVLAGAFAVAPNLFGSRATPSSTPTLTPEPSFTPSLTFTATATPSPTATVTSSPVPPTQTNTPSHTSTSLPTLTDTPDDRATNLAGTAKAALTQTQSRIYLLNTQAMATALAPTQTSTPTATLTSTPTTQPLVLTARAGLTQTREAADRPTPDLYATAHFWLTTTAQAASTSK